MLLPKSPIHFPYLSTHPEKKALAPLIGLETGSVKMAKKVMAEQGRAVLDRTTGRASCSKVFVF